MKQIIIFLLISLMALSGCDLLSYVNDAGVKYMYLEVPEKELFKDGTLNADFTVVSKVGDDNCYQFYYEIYDGDVFLKSGMKGIMMKKSEQHTTISDSFILSDVESGKHTLRYKAWWGGYGDCRSDGWKDNFINAWEDGHCPICSNLYYEKDGRCDGPACEKSLDTTIQHSLYIGGGLTSFEKADFFCVDYCGEKEIQFINTESFRGCINDSECEQFDAICKDEYCYQEKLIDKIITLNPEKSEGFNKSIIYILIGGGVFAILLFILLTLIIKKK